MAAAELSIAERVDGITQEDVRDALWRDRALVKAWTLRGTLHLHPAGELPLWYSARRAVGGVPSDGYGEFTPAELEAVYAAIREALDGRCLLREELAEAVVARIGSGPRDRLLSGWAFFLDEICQGPPRGNKVTFVLPEQWIGTWEEVDQDEALRQVCRRYLRTYGPATPNDFGQWFSSRRFKPADARALFASLQLQDVDVEGHTAHVLAGDTSFPEPQQTVRLLPEYDVYVMGSRERDQLVPEEARRQVAEHGRGKYEGPAGVRFLMIDGIAAGLWERKKRGKRVELQVTPSRKLTRPERLAIDTEAERIGAFLGLEPALTVG